MHNPKPPRSKILFKLNKTLTSNALLMLYYALVHPHFTYGIFIWGSTYKS